MKYTRYDLKRRKKNNTFFIFLVVGILILAFASGSVISKIFIKNINYKDDIKNIGPSIEKTKDPVDENKALTKDNLKAGKNFVVIQCGVFSNKDNAKAVKDRVSSIDTAFIIEEDNKSRVLMGIYTEETSNSISKKLQEKKIEFSKIKLQVSSIDQCNTQIGEIIDAYLQITTKLSDNKVKSVQTKQLKDWVSSLKDVEKSSVSYPTLDNLKQETEKLPDQIVKSDLERINEYLFKKVKELK